MLLGALGARLGALGALLDALGALLSRLGTLLGRSWGAPGGPRSVLGDLGSILVPPRVDFGPSGHRFLGLRKLLRDALGGRFCKRLATDLRAIRKFDELPSRRATGEHDELSASIDEASKEVSRDAAPLRQLRF